jgi:3-phenylpropionate/trans-cinnamate dioxygenase ferredoxin subunit
MSGTRLCGTGDVPVGEARRFTVGKAKIALVHLDEGWYALGDTCSHQKISLSEGEIHAESKMLECWKHGSCFSLIDGTPHSLPATRPVPVYGVRVEGDDVMVEI